jgi:hypothetical protein
MPIKQSRISVTRSAMELFGITFMRFRPIPRAWVTWLVAANSAALLFIGHVEAQVTLGAVAVAVLAQALIYQRLRFTRILGATHVLWVPMLAWMATRLPAVPADERGFRAWLALLMATNALSLVIDAWDAIRFVRGERAPHYAW